MTDQHPGVAFAHVSPIHFGVAPTVRRALTAWDPTVHINFPAELGFDADGIAVWDRDHSSILLRLASRAEVLDVSTVIVVRGQAGQMFYGMQIHLAARKATDAYLQLLVRSDSSSHDEYSANRIVLPARAALGPLPGAAPSSPS